ncbi:MAG: TadE/TadG family type IV pilus assembly protein [Planctomycetota bacterium]
MRGLRDERAQVMVETAIAFPVQLLITLGIMQFCLIAGGKQIVNCAAHAAARAALVDLDTNRAAALVCSPIAGEPIHGVGSPAPIFIPGRGNLRRSVASQQKTTARILARPEDLTDPDDNVVKVEVTHDFELILPFVGLAPWERDTRTETWHPVWGRVVVHRSESNPRKRVTHKVLRQTASLPIPWADDLHGVSAHPPIPDLSWDEDGETP